MNVCKECGTSNSDESKSCKSCGHQFIKKEVKEDISMNHEEENDFSNKVRNIFILVIFCSVIVSLLTIQYIKENKEQPETESVVDEDTKELSKSDHKNVEKSQKKLENLSGINESTEKRKVIDLEAGLLHKFELNEKDLSYDIYIHSGDVNSYVIGLDEEMDIGKFNDLIEEHQIDFYLAERGAEVAYKQEHIERMEFTRNISADSPDSPEWHQTLELESDTLFILYDYFELAYYRHPIVFRVSDGEVQLVDLEDMLYQYYPHFKKIEGNIVQVVFQDRGMDYQWSFETYQYDPIKTKFEPIDKRIYDMNEIEENLVADDLFKLWSKLDDMYIPYSDSAARQFSLDEILEDIPNGTLVNLPVNLGGPMIDYYNKNKAIDFIFGDEYQGDNIQVHYQDHIVRYEPHNRETILGGADFRGVIRSVIIPSDNLSFDLDDVYAELGEPDGVLDSEETFMVNNYYMYELDEYYLYFVEDVYTGEISVELSE